MNWQLYLRLWGYVRPYYRFWLLALLGYALYAATQPAMALALKYFVDGLTDPALATITLFNGLAWQFLAWIPLALVVIAVVQGSGTFLGQYAMAKVAAGVVHDLRAALFVHLLRLPPNDLTVHDSGHIVSRLTHDVLMTTSAVTDAVRNFVRDGLTVLALLSYLLWSNWQLTLVLVAVLPTVAWVANRTQRRLRQAARALQEVVGAITGFVGECVRGLMEIKAFGAAQAMQERFAAINASERTRQLRLSRVAAQQTVATQSITFAAMGVVLWLVLALRGTATVGELVAFVTAAGLLPKPLRSLTDVLPRIARGLAGAESIFEFLDARPEIDTGTHAATKSSGLLTVRHVTYRYPAQEEPALADVTFTARPGTFTAIVGASGSGKTTLARLLLRFDDPQEGEIALDGVPYGDWQRAALRRHIAWVSQQPVLFAGTVAENLALGAGDRAVTRDELIAAAKAAHAWEFIERLPQGLDTPIGENGALLSGGQRQRLALARALLKRAPVLILDEATSALDAESERHVQAALEALRAHLTLIVIAHRLTTIQSADRILVLERGRLVEAGRHEALVLRGGAYAQLFAAWERG